MNARTSTSPISLRLNDNTPLSVNPQAQTTPLFKAGTKGNIALPSQGSALPKSTFSSGSRTKADPNSQKMAKRGMNVNTAGNQSFSYSVAS